MLQYLDAPPLNVANHPDHVLCHGAWHPASHPARTTWTAPDRTITFESTPHAKADRWTLYGGENLDRAAWTIHLSTGVPHAFLAELAQTAADLFPSPKRPPQRPLPAPARGLPAAVPA
ncbi:DUF317 domain-containing protein [Streptomyces sp. NPDC047974]|uniref:DUF317 domain-containing protein n=1 Tax=Streptomyces sp. NPDC047974 TaxID=3154343 RepID=UPI0033CD22EF